jgi:hypothetical protein
VRSSRTQGVRKALQVRAFLFVLIVRPEVLIAKIRKWLGIGKKP